MRRAFCKADKFATSSPVINQYNTSIHQATVKLTLHSIHSLGVRLPQSFHSFDRHNNKHSYNKTYCLAVYLIEEYSHFSQLPTTTGIELSSAKYLKCIFMTEQAVKLKFNKFKIHTLLLDNYTLLSAQESTCICII